MQTMHTMVSAAFIALGAAALPAAAGAGGLLDAGVTIGGGKLATVNVNVGGLTGGTSPGTVTGTVVGGTVTSAPDASGIRARADVAKVLHARAQALGPRQLLRLCIAVGGKGCDSASRSGQIKLIDARAKVLSARQLASACVAVGGSCGAASASTGEGPGAGSRPRGGAAPPASLSLASAASGDSKDRDMRITCRSVLTSPARYEGGLVKLCRKIAQ